jgi:light-regulated signal transduction histidine kinase (bacteriophytochrome)
MNLTWLTLSAVLWAAGSTFALFLLAFRLRKRRHRISILEKEAKNQTAQIQELENEFNSFCYSISHDLRAPLRAVHGFSQIVLRNYKSKLDADGRQFLGIIEANAAAMNQMIEDILSYSRLARRVMSFSEIDMRKLAERSAEEVRRQFPDRKIQFEIEPLHPAYGDAVMIRQVWFQLIHNGVKFTRPKPCAVIRIESTADGEWNTFSVRDNGAGFDMQYAAKLFGLFQRLHSPEEFGGTGSGLAMVKRIVFRHGGKVWAESQPNAGSVFFFSLPKGLT